MSEPQPAPIAVRPALPDSARSLAAALWPTRWSWLLLAGLLALRLLGWHLTGVGSLDRPPLRELIKGMAWDAALLGALLAWLRWSTLRGLAGVGRALRLALASSVVLRWLDLAHCYMVGAHWSADAFLYLDHGFAGSIRDVRVLASLTAALGTAVLAMRLARRDAHAAGPAFTRLGAAQVAWVPLAVAGLASAAAAWAVRDGVHFAPHLHHPRLIPEINWLVQATRAMADPDRQQPIHRPDPETWATWQKLGLVDAKSTPDMVFPLYRQGFGLPRLPYPRRPGAIERPNAVLTLMESVNGLFIHELSGRYKGLMPEIGKLSAQMTRVDGLYNTSSPTIAAMVSVLCSIHPSTHPADLRPGASVAGQAAYTCIADLLKAQGYRAVFVQGALSEITGKEQFLRQHGFDEVHGLHQVMARFPQAPSGPWGPHDDTLVAYTQEVIARLERQRESDGRPFLLVMLTLDTHDPGMAGPDCDLPRLPNGAPAVSDVPDSAAAQKLLASYHCSDKAMGRLGQFLLDAKRRDQTLWMLTADHAAFVGLTPKEIFPTPQDRADFAPIPWLIHDPGHQLPQRLTVLSGSRDVAPTLLQLLETPDQPNSLTGRSIFGDRPAYPLLIGRIGERLAFVHDGKAPVQLPTGSVRDRCNAREALDARLDGRLSACQLAEWLDWQDSLWATRRLFPQEAIQKAEALVHGSRPVSATVL